MVKFCCLVLNISLFWTWMSDTVIQKHCTLWRRPGSLMVKTTDHNAAC